MLHRLRSLPPLRRVAEWLRGRRPRPPGGRCGIVSTSPLILHVKDLSGVETFGEDLRGVRAHFLISNAWTYEAPGQTSDLKRQHDAYLARCPRHELIYLVNTPKEVELLREQGLAAEFCASNALVDERIFSIDPAATKRYDAIYDAQLSAFKRHELCTGVASLALIAYVHSSKKLSYPHRVQSLLGHAHWFNDPFRGQEGFIEPVDVCRCYNQCRAGLALSAVEGQMYASIQYLLCGLPVVTTRNTGGRDIFFDPSFVVWVEETPESVREGVLRALRCAVPPEQIRQATLGRMQEFRDKYVGIVQGIYDRAGTPRQFAQEWPRVFFNKMVRYYTRQDLLRETGVT